MKNLDEKCWIKKFCMKNFTADLNYNYEYVNIEEYVHAPQILFSVYLKKLIN